MSHSDDISKGIYKGWLSISLTRLAIGCSAMILFLCFAAILYLWFLRTITQPGAMIIPIITPGR